MLERNELGADGKWRFSRNPAQPPVVGGRYPSVEEVKVLYFQEQHPSPEPMKPMKPLTPRQRAIIRAYFASGCCPTKAARGLGISTARLHEVKAFPAAKVYLEELEADCARAVVLARAAQILSPTLS